MSLRDIIGKKNRNGSADKEPEPEEPPQPVVGTPAQIPEARAQGLKDTVDALRKATEGNRGALNMTSILSMDSQASNMADVLQIPVGGKETDMYRMLERTRLTPYQKGLYAKAIWRAENGLGYGELKRPIPQLGTFVVFHLRASVSVNGESLAVFERTVSSWEKMLYTQEAQIKAQQAKGISQ